ncbi:MAG TPA: peroxiredoxin [Devosia sp.]|nr:peroxiredoxin [Devosia sp.]
MAELTIGKTAPEIALPTDSGAPFRLSSYRGKPVVLTFYSDGTTEGCILQNNEFSALLPEFEALGAIVVAIAPQTAAACASLRKKHHLGHILLADDGLKAVKAYGLWQQKKLWGHEFMGVIRSTVIVDTKGKVAADMKAARIKGHAAKVLETLRTLVA